VEVREEASSSSKDVVERSTVHPLQPTFTLPRVVGERVTQEGYSLRPCVGTHVSSLGSGSQGMDSVAEDAGKQSEISIESSPSIRGGVDTQSKTASPAADILSLHCRICEEPPRVTTQPTVTTCGHLFCFEYVPKLSGVIRGLTPGQVHNATRSIHVQMSRVQQFPLVVLFI
jgi:hypothetical protein